MAMFSGMKSRWADLVSGLWFVPGAIALLGLALAIGALTLDHLTGSFNSFLVFGGSASAARAVLSAIAGSLITIAGLVLSITVVTLQLVSSQYTSRVLRTFMADRLTQITAGAFVGIFGYCLLVLTTIRDPAQSGDAGYVPTISVTLSIALAFVGLALLLVFIHHIASSVQVSQITAHICTTTLAAINRVSSPGDQGDQNRSTAVVGGEGAALARAWAVEEPGQVHAGRPGFIQTVDLEGLAHTLAGPGQLRIHITVGPGDFVTPRMVIAEVWPAAAMGRTREAIRQAVSVRSERDMAQDIAFGVRQLADIALRALSPGINDPTTAITCISYLTVILEGLTSRPVAPDLHRYAGGALVVVTRVRSYADYVEMLMEVSRFSRDDARVTAALLAALVHTMEVAAASQARDRLALLATAARTVATPALDSVGTDHERTVLLEQLEQVTELEQGTRR